MGVSEIFEQNLKHPSCSQHPLFPLRLCNDHRGAGIAEHVDGGAHHVEGAVGNHEDADAFRIDFITDCLIALFFACDGLPNKSGRVIMLKETNEIKEQIKRPRNSSNRVLSQKSIFAQIPKGSVESHDEVEIPADLKLEILQYLKKHHENGRVPVTCNTVLPHHSQALQTPLQFLFQQLPDCQRRWTCIWKN